MLNNLKGLGVIKEYTNSKYLFIITLDIMANVMLVAGDDRTDPNKPFKMRIQELKDKYDVCIFFIIYNVIQ